jgi:protocatechuate 3,4-dioxygenase beta subunit
VGFFNTLSNLCFGSQLIKGGSRTAGNLRPKVRQARPRHCQVESLEPRRMMAGDLAPHVVLGSVYFEEATGDDSQPDIIQVSFEGGAAGTTLDRLVISGDKHHNGLAEGDVFFDTAAGGLGAFQYVGLSITGATGFTVDSVSVTDGGSQITFNFSGFDAGEKLVFSVDVDEAQFFEPGAVVDGKVVDPNGVDVNSLVEGAEFQRSTMVGEFSAFGYVDLTLSGTYFDAFDGNFAAAQAATGLTLKLPNDRYTTEHDFTDRTAGAVVYAQQIPLATLSGYVYHDRSDDGVFDRTGANPETGIGGVTVELLISGTPSGITTTTNNLGYYEFRNLQAGTYGVREVQPSGWIDGKDTPGSHGGTAADESAGRVDRITGAVLQVAQDAVEYNFGELLPGSIRGTIHADDGPDCDFDNPEILLSGVRVDLLDKNGQEIAHTFTDENGEYEFTGLPPGDYSVREHQPQAYFDGAERVGTAGGTASDVAGVYSLITGIHITSDLHATQYDFCEKVPAKLSGWVYHDQSNEGMFDHNTEQGIGGVVVELLDANGTPTGITTTTSTNSSNLGYYELTGLTAGTYGVREFQPTDWLDGKDKAGSHGGAAANESAGRVDRITGAVLTFGDEAVEYNFGELLPGSIAGRVHADSGPDCDFDNPELLLAGVRIDLLDAAGTLVAFTFTDANGEYKFDDLAPGEYQVFEHQPEDYYDGGERVGTVGGALDGVDTIFGIVLGSGIDAVQYDFCEKLPGSISGRVHADSGPDCDFDDPEILLAGVRIDLLDAQGNLLDFTFTNSQGEYTFDDLAPGEYQIFEHQPEEYFDGGERVGTVGGQLDGVDTILGIVLEAGVNAVQYDFCEKLPASISGRVHADSGPDCDFDDPEILLAGVRIDLLDAGGTLIDFTFTNSQGEYTFDGLAPGEYQVFEHQPEDYYDGGERVGTVGGQLDGVDTIFGIVLDAGVNAVQYDFCEKLPASISGRVHADSGPDCDFDNPELLLSGVRIDLLDANGTLIDFTFTNSQGEYTFDGLAPGEYQVFEHQPEGYYDGMERVGTNGGQLDGVDTISRIVLVSGDDALQYDFCEHIGVMLTGNVYHDRSNDGSFDRSTEEGIAGVTVKLLDGNGNDTGQRAVTNGAGFYKFNNLAAGKYAVMEVHPAGWLDGIDTPGNLGGVADASPPGDMIGMIMINWGETGEEYNFGELLPGSIRGQVVVSTDPDCDPDDGEPGIAGVRVDLLDKNGALLDFTLTDANGEYEFTGLRPGEYQVREHQPDGYFDLDAHVGSGGGARVDTNQLASIQVGSDQHLTDYDFCEGPPAELSGYVFIDGPPIATNDPLLPEDVAQFRDGRRTADDTMLAGVVIELRHGVSGDPIRVGEALPGYYSGAPDDPIFTVTDANGHYHFGGLPGGTYGVVEFTPAGLIDGVDTPGESGGFAINAIASAFPALLSAELPPPVGVQQTIEQLRQEVGNDAIVWIPLAAGQHSQENNFSEVRTQPFVPPEIPPRPVEPSSFLAELVLPPASPLIIPPLLPVKQPPDIFGGSSAVGYTWHLSVVNAGYPRSSRVFNSPYQLTATPMDAVMWHNVITDAAQWTLATVDNGQVVVVREEQFGNPRALPVVGDFNGDGISEIGIFEDGHWFLDINGNGRWDEGDLWAHLGSADDLPVTGDWDADGKTDIGIFGPAWPRDPWAIEHEPGLPDPDNYPTRIADKMKNVPPVPDEATSGARTIKLTANGKSRTDVIDHVFHYGVAGDVPLAGDWNGDGIRTIGVYRDGQWNLDSDGDGRFTDGDEIVTFGQHGDVPVIGDFNGDGVDEIGVFHNGRWVLDTNGDRQIDAQDKVFELGQAGDIPVVGDWNHDGTDDPGVYTPGTVVDRVSRRAG